MMTNTCVALLLLALAIIAVVANGFSPVALPVVRRTATTASSVAAIVTPASRRSVTMILATAAAEEGGEEAGDQQQGEEVIAAKEGEGEDIKNQEDVEMKEAEVVQEEEEQPEPEPEPEEEDPELKALKEQIAELESTLKSKRKTLSYTKDQIDEYSKAGYARKVAEMENMRRVRSNLNVSSRSSAAANVLSNFLPIYDRLNELKQKYADDAFGSKLGGLTMSPTFSEMGVSTFQIEAGTMYDEFRMDAVERVPSDTKDIVLEVRGEGLELEGNVLRPVPCVVGLGPAEEVVDESNDDGDSTDAVAVDEQQEEEPAAKE